MIVFWRMLLVLLLTDFVFQPKKFYIWKARSWVGQMAHVSIFFTLAVLLTRDYLHLVWFNWFGLNLTGIPTILFFSLLHLCMDKLFYSSCISNDYCGIKKDIPVMYKFLWHELFVLIAIFVMSPHIEITQGHNMFPEWWVIALVGLIFVSQAVNMLIATYETKWLQSVTFTDYNYITALQRVVFYALCLLPGYSWILFIIVWFWLCYYFSKTKVLDISNVNLYLGSALSVIAGLLVRAVIYYL